MLKFKGFELREENVLKDGTELLVSVENISDMEEEDFEDLLFEVLNYTDKVYIDNPTDNYFEVRSDSEFTFDRDGVDKLRIACNVLTRALGEKAIVNIGVYAGEFVFSGDNGKTFNQDDVSLEEFEKNIEY